MRVYKSFGLRPAYLDLVLALGLGVGRDPVRVLQFDIDTYLLIFTISTAVGVGAFSEYCEYRCTSMSKM